MKILVVEDDPRVSAFIKKGLEEQGYNVEAAYDGHYGKRLALENDYDLIILDIILPHLSGHEVCRRIRAEKTDVPILMLTALGSDDDKVTGLDSGADDYLVKPFSFKELLARIRALSRRRSDNTRGATLRLADLEMNVEAKTVLREGNPIRLTAKEFALLEMLLRNKGKVLSRADIAERVWDRTFDSNTNVIDVYLNYLRRKVDKGYSKKLIHTVVGMGYVLREEE